MKRKRHSAAQCGRMNWLTESAGPRHSILQSRCHWFGRPDRKQEHLQAYRGRDSSSRRVHQLGIYPAEEGASRRVLGVECRGSGDNNMEGRGCHDMHFPPFS